MNSIFVNNLLSSTLFRYRGFIAPRIALVQRHHRLLYLTCNASSVALVAPLCPSHTSNELWELPDLNSVLNGVCNMYRLGKTRAHYAFLPSAQASFASLRMLLHC